MGQHDVLDVARVEPEAPHMAQGGLVLREQGIGQCHEPTARPMRRDPVPPVCPSPSQRARARPRSPAAGSDRPTSHACGSRPAVHEAPTGRTHDAAVGVVHAHQIISLATTDTRWSRTAYSGATSRSVRGEQQRTLGRGKPDGGEIGGTLCRDPSHQQHLCERGLSQIVAVGPPARPGSGSSRSAPHGAPPGCQPCASAGPPGHARVATLPGVGRRSVRIKVPSRCTWGDRRCGRPAARPAGPVPRRRARRSPRADSGRPWSRCRLRAGRRGSRPPPASFGAEQAGHERDGELPDREHGGVGDRIGHAGPRRSSRSSGGPTLLPGPAPRPGHLRAVGDSPVLSHHAVSG